ncbi:MAG: FG-GAP repeat domain-containing protein, partial [Longimicrobiales bacterium]
MKGKLWIWTVPVLGLSAPVSELAAQRQFVANDRTLLGVATDLTASVALADIDGDGDLDVVVANGRHWPQANEVFINDGRGRFLERHQLGESWATTYGVPTGDLDGDGDIDIVVANDRVENRVFLNDGGGRFEYG